jgi:hypothetical protein
MHLFVFVHPVVVVIVWYNVHLDIASVLAAI